MKFLAAKLAPSARDLHRMAMRITKIDDGIEPMAFKILMGMTDEKEEEEEDNNTSKKKSEN